MSIKFGEAAEAFAAVAAVVIGADGVGTMEEQRALFGRVKDLAVFKDRSEEDFRALVGNVTDRVFGELAQESSELRPEAIEQLATASKAVLSAEQQKAAYQMAVELAEADGQSAEESALLGQLKKSLGV